MAGGKCINYCVSNRGSYSTYGEHGSPKQLYDEIGIDANGIAAAVREMVHINVNQLVK